MKLKLIETNFKNTFALFNDEGQLGVLELNNLGMANRKQITNEIEGEI